MSLIFSSKWASANSGAANANCYTGYQVADDGGNWALA